MLKMVRNTISARTDPQVVEYAEVIDDMAMTALQEMTDGLEYEEEDEEDDIVTISPCDLAKGSRFLKLSIISQDWTPGYEPSSDDSSDTEATHESFSGTDGMCGITSIPPPPPPPEDPVTPPNAPKPTRKTITQLDYELKRSHANIKKGKKLSPVMEGIELAWTESLASPAIVGVPKDSDQAKGLEADKTNLVLMLKSSAVLLDDTLSDLSYVDDAAEKESMPAPPVDKDSDVFCHGCSIM